jgi:hypothetical protein
VGTIDARSAAVDVDGALAHVGRTLLSDAVDVEVDLDPDFDFDFDSDPYSGRACLQEEAGPSFRPDLTVE